MSDNAVLNAFYSIFRGNKLFFVKHQPPFTEAEGKVKAAWCGFAVYSKKYDPPPEGKSEKDLIPLTIEHYREHLNGGNGLAVCPVMNVEDSEGNVIKRNVCYFAAIDIDVTASFTHLICRMYQHGFQFIAVRSKSGGLHIYFFFKEAEPADKVIETLSRIVQVFGLDRLYVSSKQKSRVEIFPKQASFVPGDKNANCLFLPFYNTKNGSPNRMINAEGQLMGITKALPVIETMFTSVGEIEGIINRLPYSDAPFCVQMILLTGALEERDGRNCFLFSAAIYLKKKYGGNFLSELEEMNRCFQSPLEDSEVASVYNSVTDKDKNYENYSCKKPPCADYCDKRLCKARKYAPYRDRNNHLTGAEYWGRLYRYDTGEDTEPYFKWEIQVPERNTPEMVQIDSHEDLLSQIKVQQCCLRDLNWVPLKVSENDWIGNVMKGLLGIEEEPGRIIKVPLAADTSKKGMLRESFMKFLTHKQIQKNGQPYMVKHGQVYYEGGVFYFDTRGLLDFLRLEKHELGRFNLGNWLVQQGCVQDAELPYQTPKGEQRSLSCWKKPETPELRAMNIFYDDVYDGDADIIQKIPVDKEDEGGGDGDDTKF